MSVYHIHTGMANSEQKLNRSERRRLQREAQKATADERQALIMGGLQSLSITCGLAALHSMFEEEADQRCGGPKGKHNPDREAYRHGTVRGQVFINGMKVPVQRPRLRSLQGGEVELESYKLAQQPEFLSEPVLIDCLSGVSQRNYGSNLRRKRCFRQISIHGAYRKVP